MDLSKRRKAPSVEVAMVSQRVRLIQLSPPVGNQYPFGSRFDLHQFVFRAALVAAPVIRHEVSLIPM